MKRKLSDSTLLNAEERRENDFLNLHANQTVGGFRRKQQVGASFALLLGIGLTRHSTSNVLFGVLVVSVTRSSVGIGLSKT